MRYSTSRLRRFDWYIWRRRLRNSLRMLFTRGDLSALIIACVMVTLPALAMSQTLSFVAEFVKRSGSWEVSLSQIVPVAILSVIFGFLLARSQYSELMALIFSGIYSFGAVLAVQFFAAPGDVFERIYSVVMRFLAALQSGFSESVGLDPFLLIIVLSVLFWFLGHNTAWHLFRLDRVWRAILPPGVVLVMNSVYNTDPSSSYDGYVILYLFLALLLLIRSHIDAREYDWYISRLGFRSSVRRWFFRLGGLVAAVTLLLAWALPTGNAQESARRFQEFLGEESLSRLMEMGKRLFGSLERQGPLAADYFGGDQLRLGDSVDLGDQIVMVVEAPLGPRYYWKSSTFDTYQDGKWTASPNAKQRIDGITLSHLPTQAGMRRDVTQRFEVKMDGSRLVYAAPQPKTFHLPVRIQLDSIERNSGIADPLTFWADKPLPRDARYSVVSSVSVASPEMLRRTGTEYPSWVTGKYLQVPPEITQRTRDLAQQIVRAANAQTPYDKAKAIETWLRQNIAYRDKPGKPPVGREPVDWVLFERREAYCAYYASAMILMLRLQGVPARMAAGFSQGVYDPKNRYFVVRGRDAHAWVEVYFPGAGWVEFEPTASQSAINRAEPEQIALTPMSSPAAAPTPIPLPTPTQPSADVIALPQMPSPLVSPTPSPSLSPSPTPSPTPTLPLPPPLELPPPVSNFLSGLLAAAAIIALLSFGGVALIWWANYRGLDRLSPIGRAYARLERAARWLGVPLSPSDTALERSKRIARALHEEEQPIMTITDAYIMERYAPRPPEIAEEKQVEAAWRLVQRALLRRWLRGKGKTPIVDS